MNTPFYLAILSYKPDPNNPLRFISTRGHPFYPVEFKDMTSKTSEDCIAALLQAAYIAGINDNTKDAN